MNFNPNLFELPIYCIFKLIFIQSYYIKNILKVCYLLNYLKDSKHIIDCFILALNSYIYI